MSGLLPDTNKCDDAPGEALYSSFENESNRFEGSDGNKHIESTHRHPKVYKPAIIGEDQVYAVRMDADETLSSAGGDLRKEECSTNEL